VPKQVMPLAALGPHSGCYMHSVQCEGASFLNPALMLTAARVAIVPPGWRGSTPPLAFGRLLLLLLLLQQQGWRRPVMGAPGAQTEPAGY